MTTEEKQARDAEVDALRQRALSAETRNIGLIHAADEANKNVAFYRRLYEYRREKHLEAQERAERAEAVVSAAEGLRRWWYTDDAAKLHDKLKPIIEAMSAYNQQGGEDNG